MKENILKFKDRDEYEKYFDENIDDIFLYDKIIIGDSEFYAIPEMFNNWRLVSCEEIDRNKKLVSGEVEPESEEDFLWVTINKELQKEINRELVDKIMKTAKQEII